jgi:hypothetical protein
VYVPTEAVNALSRHLAARAGPEVVLRPLAPADDAPALPRAVAGLPFSALAGLAPRRFGETSGAALLALAAPLAFGVALADLAGGLLLFAAGGLLSLGASPGSPRRQSAALAELAGFVALVAGLLLGRAFGALGSHWFGEGWGFLGDGASGLEARQRLFLGLLGGAGAALGLWGLLLALGHALAGAKTRARTALLGALLVVPVASGGLVASSALPAGLVGPVAALAPVALGLSLLLAGPVAGLGRGLLDLVGSLRLAGVCLLSLWLFDRGFAAFVPPLDPGGATLGALVLGVLGIAVASLAVLVDPAHVAMGVPYDLSLGSRALAEPFAPLQRQPTGGGGVR